LKWYLRKNLPVQTGFFQYKNATLCYSVMGGGPKTMFFFHGYGQSKEAFYDKMKMLKHTHTSYSFDLFFHGESSWRYGENVIIKEFWAQLIKAFLDAFAISRFSMTGFSLGARFVMATLESVPDCIDQINLLAPDGVKTNFWYNLATYPVAFRKLFKSMILHPSRFFSLAHAIHTIGLVDKGLVRFAESQMKTEEMRYRVYYSWVVFRALKFDMRAFASFSANYSVEVNMIIGRYDKVITLQNMRRLLKHLPTCHVIVVNTGHNGIIEKWESGARS
jgi:pimeloyl-ACP methyl ester carboxylesterase